MFWFVPYRFTFPAGVNGPERLKATLADPKWQKVQNKVSDQSIQLWHKLPVFFNNSWNPIFDGRFVMEQGTYHLKGHFRVAWIVLAINILMLAMPLYELWDLWGQPSVRPGYIEGWKERQMEWNLTFLGAVAAITFVGWLFGLPHEKRILSLLNESSCA